MTNDTRLLLVDASSYLFRAFHAMPALQNSAGRPTGAIYGVVNMLKRLLKDYPAQNIGVVFDAKGKTFRDELYADYKAHRPPMPEALAEQIEPLHELVEALGLPVIVVPGVEADDVIGTLARHATARQINTIISTGDKDMAQLVNDRVTLVNTMNDTVLDRQGVMDKFGVTPEQIIDYLALVGDSVDNIPGIPGVGPKTAAKWLREYGDLENLIASADKIRGKAGENLRRHLDSLHLSRQLATIKTDLPLDFSLTDLKPQAANLEALKALYQELEFKTWLREVLDNPLMPAEVSAPAVRYERISDYPTLEQWLQRIAETREVAVDLETTSLDYMQAEIVGISLAVQPCHAAYIAVAHRYEGAPPQPARDEVLARLKPMLTDPRIRKIGQNLKYDISVLARHGIEMAGAAFDTMLESYVIDSTASRHDMDSLALKYLGYKTTRYEDVAGKGAKQINFAEVHVEEATHYAAEDADITLRLHQKLWPMLQAQDKAAELFLEIEMPLVPVLSRMERTGVRIDAGRLQQQSRQIEQRLHALEQQAHQSAGQAFNLGSPKQIREILFEKLKLPVIQKTPKGDPSTAESVLKELALDYPLPKIILEYRGLAKLKSTYTDKLPQQINPDTGRVHTSYHQAVAATGRLSSADPNLQNIPIRTEEGRRIRQAFVAEPGFTLLAADYSQIELRIMAHLSGDQRLLEAFSSGVDIHRATAAEIFSVAPAEVSTEQRRSAKAINFGLIYGMSAYGLARQLGIDRNAAQHYVDLYFQRYPGVKAFMDRMRTLAREQGYVETVFGRRLYLPEINASNHQRRQYAERAAINAPMQGTAADIIKRAMITIDRWIRTSAPEVRMIMQVHDELVFEIPRDDVKEYRSQIVAHMAGAAELAVPLVVETGFGENWDEAH